MAQKNFYYIGVMDNEVGMKFVTGFDKQSKMALWDKDKKPLALTQQTAKDYAEALAANLVPATVVRTFWELDNQPCWVMTEDEKNIDKLSSLVADTIKNYKFNIKHNKAGFFQEYSQDFAADVNLYTGTIRALDYDYNDIVKFVPSERSEDREVTAYEIYPYPPMWQLFKDTQENRESFVEQLESKTGKVFAFADDKTDRVNVYARVKEQETNDDEQNEKLELTTSPKDNEEYLEEDEELDLTQGNGRSR